MNHGISPSLFGGWASFLLLLSLLCCFGVKFLGSPALALIPTNVPSSFSPSRHPSQLSMRVGSLLDIKSASHQPSPHVTHSNGPLRTIYSFWHIHPTRMFRGASGLHEAVLWRSSRNISDTITSTRGVRRGLVDPALAFHVVLLECNVAPQCLFLAVLAQTC